MPSLCYLLVRKVRDDVPHEFSPLNDYEITVMCTLARKIIDPPVVGVFHRRLRGDFLVNSNNGSSPASGGGHHALGATTAAAAGGSGGSSGA